MKTVSNSELIFAIAIVLSFLLFAIIKYIVLKKSDQFNSSNHLEDISNLYDIISNEKRGGMKIWYSLVLISYLSSLGVVIYSFFTIL